MKDIIDIESITQMHDILGVQGPDHPMISVNYTKDLSNDILKLDGKYRLNLYMISLKINCNADFKYGRNSFDFQEGTLIFTSPGQVFDFEDYQNDQNTKDESWTLIIHPDFIRNTTLAKSINTYSFFDYDAYEALHVSEKEKKVLLAFVNNINIEINQNIDKHSQQLISINLESLLSYSLRYFERQFFTRTNQNKGHLIGFEKYLKEYFSSPQIINQGLPTVQQCGEALNMSGYYLSDLLKVETGKSAKEQILLYFVEQAKNKLLGSTCSVSEIAFDFGFEYPQHFSKLFKSKTGVSPSEYRNLN